MKKSKIYFYLFLIFGLLFFLKAEAADVYSVSSYGQVNENQTFSVTFYTDTKNTYINNIEANIKFPADLINVESVNINGSIFNMWIEQPKYSNTEGTMSFNGGVANPGYAGSSGKIFNVFFKAKKVGDANIYFTSANIYANDGLGTDVTSLKRGVSVKILPYIGAETKEEIITSEKLPTSPTISSLDMPDEDSWYSIKNVTFSWNLPWDITSTQLLFDNKTNSTPSVTYSPPISKKEIRDIKDGIFYLHVRLSNSSGYGKTSHRAIKVDTTSPSMPIVSYLITNDDFIGLNIKSNDITSGIAKYKILIDGTVVSETNTNKTDFDLILPSATEGDHEVSVVVYDKAGNLSEKNITITFPRLKSPQIIDFSEEITKGEEITIEGISYKNSDIRIWLEYGGENENKFKPTSDFVSCGGIASFFDKNTNNPASFFVKTDKDGKFKFISDPTSCSGVIQFWAEVVRNGDITGISSEKNFIVINKTSFAEGSILTVEALSFVFPVILLIIVLIYLSLHAYYKLRRLKKKLMRDIEDTESEVHKIFRIMKEDAKNIMHVLNKKDIKSKLTEKDIEAMDLLSRDIEEGEAYFEKRLENIEKKDL